MGSKLIGIDIGNSDVKLAVMRGGTFRLATERMPDNLVQNDRIVSPELLARFINQTRIKHKLGGGACAVILPEYGTFFRRMTIPAMTAEQLELNLPYEFRDYTGNSNTEYFYDYAVERTTNDENGTPTSIDIVAAAAQKDLVRQYAELLRRAGMRLSVALPREMALINLLQRNIKNGGPMPAEYGIIDLGYAYTRLYIFEGASLKAYRAIDIGCSHIDDAIADEYNIDKYLAANYRAVNHENALNNRRCTAVYEQISLELRKAVSFYNYDKGANALNDVYCAGGGSDVKPLRDLIVADVGFRAHSIAELLPKHSGDDSMASRCMAAIGVVL
jgi:type IV pilus assembly protein PilM